MTPGLIIDIGELFKGQFGSKPYVVSSDNPSAPAGDPYKNVPASTKGLPEFINGSTLREQYLGVEIFLPIRIYDEGGSKELMYLPYCVIAISGKNTFISTPMIDRKGSVKELYSPDDYKISVKGFLIGADRKFPDAELKALAELKNKTTAVVLDNAITNIFLSDKALKNEEQRRVVVTDFTLPDVQGGREHVRPFTLELESDTVFDLELA